MDSNQQKKNPTASTTSPRHKSNNPNNPDCSRAVQMVLDLKKCLSINGRFTFDELLEYMECNHDERDCASNEMVSHEYNSVNITFDKKYKCLEYRRYITAAAFVVLDIMICGMRTNNLIRMSQDDIKRMTSLNSKSTVAKAIDDLLHNGCIAIVIPGSRNRSPVYMVNPLIATNGKDKQLQRVFWQYTGTEYNVSSNSSHAVKSEPHQLWDAHEHEKTFSIGYDKQVTNKGIVYFNKFNEPQIDITNEHVDNVKPSADATADGYEKNTGDCTSILDFGLNGIDSTDGNLPFV